jgi:magnesium transporter
VIEIILHSNDGTRRNSVRVAEISERLKQPDTVLWVDVTDPQPDEITLLGEEFGFHPLALEDAVRPHQRPKIEAYQSFFFMIFYALNGSDPPGVWNPRQIAIFIGKNYVVTVHSGPLQVLEETASRWCERAPIGLERTTGLLVYSLLDAIVDDYFPVIDDISEEIEALEDRIFVAFDAKTQQQIFSIKKELLAIRRVVAPERDVLNVLLRRDSPIFSDATMLYFQDVYDHVLRVTDAVDNYRDLLSGALDVYLSVTSNRMNQVMKTLTASSIILMSMTLVASVYGMNFDHMPELHWQLGYLWALGLMFAIGVGLLRLFKRIDWL